MAAGDVMLDADGNVILQEDGDVLLSDGVGDDCCCAETPQHCWARWEAVYDCEDDPRAVVKTLLSMDCASATPDYAAGWTQTEQNGSFTKWLYDQDLGECVDGICDEDATPTTPGIADPSTTAADEACCDGGKVCLYAWEVTYTPAEVGGGGTWGEVAPNTSDYPQCATIDSTAILNAWFYVSSSDGVCTFRYLIAGDCCEDSSTCSYAGIDDSDIPLPDLFDPPAVFTDLAYQCDQCLDYGNGGVRFAAALLGTTPRGCFDDYTKSQGSADAVWPDVNYSTGSGQDTATPGGWDVVRYPEAPCAGTMDQPTWDFLRITTSFAQASSNPPTWDVTATVTMAEDGYNYVPIGTYTATGVPGVSLCCNWPAFVILSRNAGYDSPVDLYRDGFILIENLSCPLNQGGA